MSTPHGVRVRLLLAVALVAGLVSWVGLTLWGQSGRQVPSASWAAAPILLAVAVGLVLAGRPVRRLVQGTATKPVHPLYAARVLSLAQAAALTGAAVLGWYAAQVVRLLPDVDVPSQQQDVLVLAVLGLGAVLVSAAGLLVQHWCRVDDDRDERDERDRRGGSRDDDHRERQR
ncbi:DUF3180 domain-containing protein [Lapillicoccus jejuensis]|uniref:DUF3180 domain-containing protein n=1 Tax=Lapillicoccus jejuensis TaxID=402171 RepID=UPI00147768B3|nr:DUF3180 domain-containing protein [Lapillicoccus jejuensis]